MLTPQEDLDHEAWLVQSWGTQVSCRVVIGRSKAFTYAADGLGPLSQSSKELLCPLMEGRVSSTPGNSWTVYSVDGKSYADVTRVEIDPLYSLTPKVG